MNPEEAEIGREMFDIFLWEETDAGTRRNLKTEYGDDLLKAIACLQVPDDVTKGYAGP